MNCYEEVIFRAVIAWGKNRPSEDLEEVMSHVRLPLLPQKILVEEIFPLKIVPQERLLEALVYQTAPHQFDLSQIQFQRRFKVCYALFHTNGIRKCKY